MTKMLLSSTITLDSWVLYLIMGILILLNMLLITYILVHSPKDPASVNKVEASRKVKEDSNVSVAENPAHDQKIYTTAKTYRVVANEKQGGWYVKKRGEKTPIAYAKTKEEAEEIKKSLE